MRKPIVGLVTAGLMTVGLSTSLVTTTASATTAPHRADTGSLIALTSSNDTSLPSCPTSTLCTFQNSG